MQVLKQNEPYLLLVSTSYLAVSHLLSVPKTTEKQQETLKKQQKQEETNK